jgi:activating signal cointegrator complex subunit 2
VQAASAEEASRVATARAATSAAQIHGLGAGGNRSSGPVAGSRAAAAAADGSDDESSEEEEDASGGRAGGRGSGGRGGGRGGGGDGRAPVNPERERARKDKNKAAVGNHHRKDRAAHKQRALLGPT